MLNYKPNLIIRQVLAVVRMESTQTVKKNLNVLSINETKDSIKEGQAEILLKTKKVFYNPVQEFNRDLSIAVLTVFGDEFTEQKTAKALQKSNGVVEIPKIEFTILEALSATGLRSIRYAKEIPNVTRITANDISLQAVETIKENIIYNNVQDLVDTSEEDACMIMYKHKNPSQRFVAVDLDPYGCPSIFLDSAVQSVQDGGLLLVTATDMAILAGNSPETCYTKYGSISLKTKCCHEMALRILLQCIEHHANRYSRYIEPLISISADFYIRVFVKLHSGAQHCKKTTSKLSLVYQCVGCDHLTLQPLGGFKPNPSEKNPGQMKSFLPLGPPVQHLCEHCNQKHRLGGPIWSAPIHNETFVTKVLSHVRNNPQLFATSKRIEGILSMVREELTDVPLYYTTDRLFGRVHLVVMPMIILRSAILNAGYKVSYSHACKNSIKTTAPGDVVWDIIRTWARIHPAKSKTLESDQIANYILSKEPKLSIDLNPRADANPISRREGSLRFQLNPMPFWGPGSRAEARVGDTSMAKSVANQNKYTNKEKRNKRELSPKLEDNSRKKTNTEC